MWLPIALGLLALALVVVGLVGAPFGLLADRPADAAPAPAVDRPRPALRPATPLAVESTRLDREEAA